MNELTAAAIILLLALLAGHLVKFVRVPEVTGYILAGVVVGPSGFGWITHNMLTTFEIFSQIALGLILFSIGSVFEVNKMRATGARVAGITIFESLLAAGLVGFGMLAAGQPWPIALMLGAIAIETAAASTLMVIREVNSEGPLTETLTTIIAMNNIVCLVGFSIAASALELTLRTPSTLSETLALTLWPLMWQMIGSLALGYLIGLLLASWASQVHEHGEVLILLTGCVLLSVGVSQSLGLSPLITSLSVGATMANMSGRSRSLFDALSKTDPPLYAIFFVVAGADLNVALLPSLGVLGVIYAAGRAAGKFFGARYAAKRAGLAPVVRKHLGTAMLSQAGLAIGLVLVVNERFPTVAPIVTTVVLAAVTLFELVGPLSARFALVRSGEARPVDDRTPVL